MSGTRTTFLNVCKLQERGHALNLFQNLYRSWTLLSLFSLKIGWSQFLKTKGCYFNQELLLDYVSCWWFHWFLFFYISLWETAPNNWLSQLNNKTGKKTYRQQVWHESSVAVCWTQKNSFWKLSFSRSSKRPYFLQVREGRNLCCTFDMATRAVLFLRLGLGRGIADVGWGSGSFFFPRKLPVKFCRKKNQVDDTLPETNSKFKLLKNGWLVQTKVTKYFLFGKIGLFVRGKLAVSFWECMTFFS